MPLVIPVEVERPNYWCPDCGRLLVLFDNQGMTLAGKARVTSRVDISTGQGLAVQATCLRWPCRLRRWIRR